MLVAARSPVCVGVAPWPGHSQLWTVVVKRTYDVVPRGAALLAERQQNLQVESVDARGHLVHPSDFVLTKHRCDVVLVGEALAAPGPARLAVDPVRKLVESPREMGPRRAPGDPSDPMFGEAWASAHVDGDASQCAPVDQRRTCTAPPLEVSYEVGAARVSTRIEGLVPQVVLLDRTGWSAPSLIAVHADTILVDPAAAQITLLFRGCVRVHEGSSPLLVVEAQQPLRSFSPRAMEHWPQAEAAEPALLRRLRAMVASLDLGAKPGEDEAGLGETTARLEVARGGPTRGAPPPAPSFGPPPPLRDTPSARPSAAPVAPTPMLGGMMMLPLEVRSQPPPPGEASTRRTVRATLVDDGGSEDDDDPLAGTVQATVPSELRPRPLPFAASPAVQPEPVSSSPQTRPLPARPAPSRRPGRTLLVEEVAARAVAQSGTLDTKGLPFVSPTPGVPLRADAMKTSEDDGPPTERPLRTEEVALDLRATRRDDDVGVSTVTTTVPPELRGLPFSPAAAAPHTAPLAPRVTRDVAPRETAPRPAIPTQPPRVGSGAFAPLPSPSTSSSPSSPQEPARGAGPRPLTGEEFGAIRAELWGRRATRREVLTKYGFTELGWRLAERRFMKSLAEGATPERLVAVLARLHVAVEREELTERGPREGAVRGAGDGS